MKLHHFLIEDIDVTKLKSSIAKIDVIHQIKNVLKLKQQEKIVLLDGKGKKVEAVIERITAQEIKFFVNNVVQIPTSACSIILYCSLLKKEYFEWMLQKATELGVVEIVPLLCERTIKTKIDTSRLKKIIKEATEQSERAYLPKLREGVFFKEIIKEKKDDETYLFFDKDGKKITSFSKKIFHKKRIHVFIGPEGGWTLQEKIFAQENTFLEVSINENVLRAETAALSAVTLISCFLN